MNFTKIKRSLKEAFIRSGYSRTAIELLKLSDRQLDDIGVTRALLQKGHSAYPWRAEALDQVIPDNVSSLNTAKKEANSPILSRASRAA